MGPQRGSNIIAYNPIHNQGAPTCKSSPDRTPTWDPAHQPTLDVRLRVERFGFRVRVEGSGFRVQGSGFRV